MKFRHVLARLDQTWLKVIKATYELKGVTPISRVSEFAGGNHCFCCKLHWGAAFKLVLLVQPNAASAEKVFSLLQKLFSERQSLHLKSFYNVLNKLEL